MIWAAVSLLVHVAIGGAIGASVWRDEVPGGLWLGGALGAILWVVT